MERTTDLLATVSGGTTISYAISGKAYGTYYYKLAACISGDCSSPSTAVSVLVSKIPNGVPTGLLLSPNPSTSGNYTLSWNSAPGSANYQIYEAVGTGSYASVATPTGTSYGFSKSQTGSYSYYVQACNPVGCSGDSTTVTETVSSGAAVPGTPSSIGLNPTSVTAGSGQHYTLTWGAASGAVSYYQVLKGNTLSSTTAPTTLSMTYTAPASPRAEGTAKFSVEACNTTGCSIPTAPVTETFNCGVESPGGGDACSSGGGGGGNNNLRAGVEAPAQQMDSYANATSMGQVYASRMYSVQGSAHTTAGMMTKTVGIVSVPPPACVIRVWRTEWY